MNDDHAQRIKNNNKDNRNLEGSRCDLWRWIRHGAALSSHYQQLHMTGDSFHEHACAETLNSILISTEDALCVFDSADICNLCSRSSPPLVLLYMRKPTSDIVERDILYHFIGAFHDIVDSVTVLNICVNVCFWGVWWSTISICLELKLMLMRSCDSSLQLSLSAHDGSGILRGQRVSLQHGGRRREDRWLWVRGENFSRRSPPLITADTPSVIMDPSRSEEPSRL